MQCLGSKLQLNCKSVVEVNAKNQRLTVACPSCGLGPVSRKFRNFSGVFRETFSLYRNEGVSRRETLQLFLFLSPLQHMKRPALQNKQVVLSRMAFRRDPFLESPENFSGPKS